MGQETCTYMHAYSVPVSPSHVTTEVNTPPANAMPAKHTYKSSNREIYMPASRSGSQRGTSVNNGFRDSGRLAVEFGSRRPQFADRIPYAKLFGIIGKLLCSHKA